MNNREEIIAFKVASMYDAGSELIMRPPMKRKEDKASFFNTTNNTIDPMPNDILKQIGTDVALTEKDINNWAMTCNRFHTVFRGPYYWSSQLRICVVHGKQDRAEILLKINLHLMINKGEVTDYSGRLFPCISGFQYALGALDTRYMVGMMLDCIRENISLTVQEKKDLLMELLNQYEQVEKEGVFYLLDGKEHREKHFGFTPLLKALQEYENNVERWSEGERIKYFSAQVGKAQYYVPAHVAQHYCHPDVPFKPRPDFRSKVFIRCLDVSNYLCDKPQKWWDVDDLVLGIDCGIIREGKWWAGRFSLASTVSHDLDATSELFKIRKDDYCKIPKSLMELMQTLDPTKDDLVNGLMY